MLLEQNTKVLFTVQEISLLPIYETIANKKTVSDGGEKRKLTWPVRY